MSTKRPTTEGVVAHYRSIGMEARVLRHDSFEDAQAAALGVDQKAADQLYAPAKFQKTANDDSGKRAASSKKRTPPKHPKKGSAEAREKMEKLRSLRGKSKTNQQEMRDGTTDESKADE